MQTTGITGTQSSQAPTIKTAEIPSGNLGQSVQKVATIERQVFGNEENNNTTLVMSSSSSSAAGIRASLMRVNAPIETKITKEEYQQLRQWWEKWATSGVSPVNENPDVARVLELSTAETQLAYLENLHDCYQTLSTRYHGKIKPLNAQDRRKRGEYPIFLSLLTCAFQQLCIRDTAIHGRKTALYHQLYQTEIDPCFRLFQRYANFLNKMLEMEEAKELKHPLRLLKIEAQQIFPNSHCHLAFERDSGGWLPLAFNFNPNTLEVSAIYYGDSALPSVLHDYQTKVMMVDHAEMVTQSGFIVDAEKRDGWFMVSVSGYFGTDSPTPYLNTPYGEKFITDMDNSKEVKELVQRISPILPEIASFANDPKPDREVYFVPLPMKQDEREEFSYLLLQHLMHQLTASEEERNNARTWIKQIEQVEGKPIGQVIKEQEAAIKEKLRTEYELEVEEEQQQRSQQVASGATKALRKDKKNKNEKKPHAHSQSASPSKTVDQAVEERFQAFRVKGPIKYRRLIQMTKQMMKQHPEAFSHIIQEENQRGSHHVLHTEQGPLTLVQPHGKKDNVVSAKMANRFCDALLDQVRRTMESFKKDKVKLK